MSTAHHLRPGGVVTQPDPYTAAFALCDPDGIVRSGAMHHGTDYPCTGSAHYAGAHIRCTSQAHAPSRPIAYDPERHDPPVVLDVHHAALQEIDRVVGNQPTLNEGDTARLRGILFAALSGRPTPPPEETA